MSRTLLQLCQDIVGDLGIAGGTLQSTTGSSLNNEQRNIVKWVKRADLLVQNLWVDWRFLWYQDPAVLVTAGSNIATPVIPAWAAGIRSYDRMTMFQNYGTYNARPIPWMDWDQFFPQFVARPTQQALTPSCWSNDPNGVIYLSQKLIAQTNLNLQYWCDGLPMAADQSISRIPIPYDSIIVERAKIIYAERENAAEIFTGSTAEYSDMLDKMQAFCLPNNTAGRRSRNDRTTTPQSYVE
jgi:hypothetical protein